MKKIKMINNQDNSRIDEDCDIYKLFSITDEKKELFSKMTKEWSLIKQNEPLKSYNTEPINTEIRGLHNA